MKNMNEKSIKNLLIFGRTSSGKSTLSGYLYSYKNEEEANALLEKKKRDLQNKNIKYLVDDQYAYIMDSVYETARNQGKVGKEGTTIDLKIRHSNEINLNIIDSPGIVYRFIAQDKQKLYEKRNTRITQGITMSDIGIFTIEARDFMKIEEEEGQYAFNRLCDFISRKGEQKAIVALTKCDTFLNEQKELEDIYVYCNEYIKEELKFSNCLIIPIGIIARERTDINVLKNNAVFDFYKGPSILDAIIKYNVEDQSAENNNNFSYSLVQREYKIDGIGKVWQCKMVENSLFLNDKVILGPVKLNKKTTAILGTIKNLQNSKKVDTSFVGKGDIFGADISFKEDKANIKIEKNISFLVKYDKKVTFKSGNYLEINNVEKELPFDRFEYALNWYGKKIKCFLREKKEKSIEVILENDVIMPFYEDKIFESFISICLENDSKQYLTGKIKNLLKIESVYFDGKETSNFSYNKMLLNKNLITFKLNSSFLDIE